jgi:hypothetical protein
MNIRRSDITGFTFGPIEIVFVFGHLCVIALAWRGRTIYILDR